MRRFHLFVALLIGITSLSAAFLYMTSRGENPLNNQSKLTQEEAIEISRNSSTMQNLLENSTDYKLDNVQYLNITVIEGMKKQNPQRWEIFPEDHGVWLVEWGIRLKAYGIDSVMVTQYISEVTGELLWEGVIWLD